MNVSPHEEIILYDHYSTKYISSVAFTSNDKEYGKVINDK